MIISPEVVTAAKANGSKTLAASGTPGEPLSQVDAVVDLLTQRTSPAAQPGARKLLTQMAEGIWRVIRGKHRSTSDPTPHVLIEVQRNRYHLRLDKGDHVFDITRVVGDEAVRPAGHNPWVPPGA